MWPNFLFQSVSTPCTLGRRCWLRGEGPKNKDEKMGIYLQGLTWTSLQARKSHQKWSRDANHLTRNLKNTLWPHGSPDSWQPFCSISLHASNFYFIFGQGITFCLQTFLVKKDIKQAKKWTLDVSYAWRKNSEKSNDKHRPINIDRQKFSMPSCFMLFLRS